jgi:hypothetical protein
MVAGAAQRDPGADYRPVTPTRGRDAPSAMVIQAASMT